MKSSIKIISGALALTLFIGGCKKKDYAMGDLVAPSDVAINATLAGVDASHPNGDGSGDVTFELTGKNALAYKIDFDAADGISLDNVPSGKVTRKYTTLGLNTYRVTVVAYGRGASATTITKEIQVQSNFTPDPTLLANLVGTTGKTWKVDKAVPAHFGVGPWSTTSVTPEWYAASPNEKAGCCNCFYTASFTFKQTGPGAYSLAVASPDGAFTKTGALAGGLPGIPGSGDEGCYGYSGGTSSFSLVPSSSGISASTPSTKTAILLGGNNTYIGYGAQKKEYEILSITATTMDLRVQGTETGNAWYLKLKAD